MNEDTHSDRYVTRRGAGSTILHMRDQSFYAESAAYIVVSNAYSWRFEAEDADYWYDQACRGGIIFW